MSTKRATSGRVQLSDNEWNVLRLMADRGTPVGPLHLRAVGLGLLTAYDLFARLVALGLVRHVDTSGDGFLARYALTDAGLHRFRCDLRHTGEGPP